MVEPCKPLPLRLLHIYELVTIYGAGLHQFPPKALQVLKRRNGTKQLRQNPYWLSLVRGNKNVQQKATVHFFISTVVAATFSNDVAIMVVS